MLPGQDQSFRRFSEKGKRLSGPKITLRKSEKDPLVPKAAHLGRKERAMYMHN